MRLGLTLWVRRRLCPLQGRRNIFRDLVWSRRRLELSSKLLINLLPLESLMLSRLLYQVGFLCLLLLQLQLSPLLLLHMGLDQLLLLLVLHLNLLALQHL